MTEEVSIQKIADAHTKEQLTAALLQKIMEEEVAKSLDALLESAPPKASPQQHAAHEGH